MRVLQSDHTNQCTSQALSHMIMVKYQVFRRFVHVNHLQTDSGGKKFETVTNSKGVPRYNMHFLVYKKLLHKTNHTPRPRKRSDFAQKS